MVHTTLSRTDEDPPVLSVFTSNDYSNVANIGSLYNAQTGRFVKHPKLLREPIWFTLKQSINVNWWKIDDDDWDIYSTGSNQQDELFSKFYMLQSDIERDGYLKRFSYPYPNKKNTYFLLYSFICRDLVLPSRPYLASLFFSPETFEKLDVEATHIVYSIKSGIEILFTISISSDQVSNKQVICLLDKICSILRQKLPRVQELNASDQTIWAGLNIQYQINSCVPDCKLPQDIHTIIYRIKSMETQWFSYEHPIEYIFKPVQWILNKDIGHPSHVIGDDDPNFSEKIRQNLLQMNTHFHRLAASIENNSLTDQNPFEESFQQIKNERSVMLREVWESYQDIANNPKKLSDLYDYLCQMTEELQKKCDELDNDQKSSESSPTNQQRENEKLPSATLDTSVENNTGPSISSDEGVSSNQIEKQSAANGFTIEPRLTLDKDSVPALSQSIPEVEKDGHNQGDNNLNSNVKVGEECETLNSTSTVPPPISDPAPQSVKNINILLIGQSGVGKSTFVNAFVNYLAFPSLDEAKCGEPIALIPVSFLITSGFEYKETTIKFGTMDANENYDHPGQSVTQECRSYVFDISEKLRLRIIDTPGIGDTRGIEQDEKNIDQILFSLGRFSHINAICILLHPNISRMDVFFRFCIQRIFTYLSANASDNIVFCFTNVRSTFYSVGNTGPLLKKFLTSLPIQNIPYGKKNSFAFDSESFRYLACIKNGFQFDDADEEEVYAQSWTKAIPESIKFFKYVRSLKPYEIHRWQSVGHAKIQIQTLVQPMVEALRTLFINRALVEARNRSLIGLIAKRIDDPNVVPAVCYCCAMEKVPVGLISITKYSIHYFNQRISGDNQRCNKCACDFTDHQLVDYEIDYVVDSQVQIASSELEKDVETLNKVIETLASLIQPANPYLAYYNRFPAPKIVSEQVSLAEIVNRKLDELKRNLENIPTLPNPQDIDLNDIYENIKKAKALPIVKIQVEAIEQRQERMHEHNEKIIRIPKDASAMLAKLTEEN